jgi:hypothetical protein
MFFQLSDCDGIDYSLHRSSQFWNSQNEQKLINLILMQASCIKMFNYMHTIFGNKHPDARAQSPCI